MVVTLRNTADIVTFKSRLVKHFEITDMGEIRWFLGFTVKWDRAAQTISINQQAYIQGVAEKFRLTNAKAVTMPMESGTHLTKDQGLSTPQQAS
jgi:hypothetical protein